MITEFRGSTGFLSNFTDVSIQYEGNTYKSVEHAYMAAKNETKEWKDFCLTHTAGECKKASKSLTFHTVKGWYKKRLVVMESFIDTKVCTRTF